MPFTPHTDAEIQDMLNTIGVSSIADLFDEIPNTLDQQVQSMQIAEGINEQKLTRLMQMLAAKDEQQLNFIGAGAYQHHIPAAVWDLVGRGEFMTAYTPYQAEASQGGLQVIYEYQTMMANLMAMDVSNASLYDGATALAEAVLMAVRANKKSKANHIAIIGPIAPNYLKTVQTIVQHQGIMISTLPANQTESLTQDITAAVIVQPNFLGHIQKVDQLTDWAHGKDALVIGLVNPMAMALLKAPGHWGEQGVDIVCGEGQPLGVPLAGGGPYFGFMCCKQAIVRQMPGRIVGRSTDIEGKPGFCLTLQAREQHIRRSKATSNICTNQGLLVTAATIYMSLLGFDGLKQVALKSHENALALSQKLRKISGVTLQTNTHFFHEFVIQLPSDVQQILQKLSNQNIQAGYALNDFDGYENCLLICSTEMHNEADHDQLAKALKEAI